MKHIKIEIVANEYQQEELIALLDEFCATGFEQTNEKLMAYFVENSFEKREVIHLLNGYQYEMSELDEQNWNEVWEQNFHPVVVDDFCAVRAHFHESITSVEHEIVITPKMSFGTGHHATTYMMMKQMQVIDFSNKTVFDFGTGTGILAILAYKLGAARVTAIDVDDWSIENARENFVRNNCTEIDVQLSTTIPSAQFDVILANINRNVILQYIVHLKNALGPHSLLLLSGLLAADEGVIISACEANSMQLQLKLERGGWISLLFGNRVLIES
jgi:ribosomal protein L11 methyltransferase